MGKSRDILIRFLGDSKSVKAETDQVEASLKGVEQQAEKTGGAFSRFRQKSADATKGVKHDADQSRSVGANLAGNLTQDFANLGGVVGSAGVGMGQLVEYAADGNVKLKGMATAGVALGAAALVMGELADRTAEIAKNKAWTTDQINGYVEALKRGEDAATALAARLTEAGKIEFKLELDGIADTFGASDITGVLAQQGITVGQFTEAVTGGKEGLERLSEAMRAAGVDVEAMNLILAAAEQQAGYYGLAQERATAFQRVFAAGLQSSVPWFKRAADGFNELATNASGLEREFDGLTRTTDRAAGAVGGAGAALDKAAGGFPGITREAGALARELERISTAYDGLTANLAGEATFNGLQQTFIDLKNSSADAMTAVADGSMTAEEAAVQMTGKIIAAKQQVQEYGEKYKDIPPEVITDILTQLDQGKLDEAETALTKLEEDRNVKLWLDTAEADRQLDALISKYRTLASTFSGGGGTGGGIYRHESLSSVPAGFSAGSAAGWFSSGAAAEAEVDEIEMARRRYERGEIDLAQYRQILVDKQAGLDRYSDEEQRIYEMLRSLDAEATRSAEEENERRTRAFEESEERKREELRKTHDLMRALRDARNAEESVSDALTAAGAADAALYTATVKAQRGDRDAAASLPGLREQQSDAYQAVVDSVIDGVYAQARAAGLAPDSPEEDAFVRAQLAAWVSQPGRAPFAAGINAYIASIPTPSGIGPTPADAVNFSGTPGAGITSAVGHPSLTVGRVGGLAVESNFNGGGGGLTVQMLSDAFVDALRRTGTSVVTLTASQQDLMRGRA